MSIILKRRQPNYVAMAIRYAVYTVAIYALIPHAIEALVR